MIGFVKNEPQLRRLRLENRAPSTWTGEWRSRSPGRRAIDGFAMPRAVRSFLDVGVADGRRAARRSR